MEKEAWKVAARRSWVGPLTTSVYQIVTHQYSVRMKKSMAEKQLRKMGIKSMKMRLIRQCLGNGERKSLWRGDQEPQRDLILDFPFLTGIYCDWFVQHANVAVDSYVNQESSLPRDEDIGIFEDLANNVLAMASDPGRVATNYITMQILGRASAVTISIASRLRCNMMSTWNLRMRKEKELVSGDLCRGNSGSRYMG